MPHGYSYHWNPGLVWLHVISDLLITLAYMSIPITLAHFVRKRRDLPFDWMFLCFGVFIMACGATHAMEVWNLWHGAYWLAGVLKAITAFASVPTAVLLLQLVPKALALPSPEDVRKANKALVRAKEEAERASRFKDQFLSTMSHELRTPLNSVLGFSALLAEERYGTLNERQARYVSHIHNGGQHLLNLINDILDLSKIEAGRLELAIENVLVPTALAEVTSTLRSLAEKKSQTLSQFAATGLAIRADSTRFKQVLMNLVGNAIKFSPAGGRIELVAHKTDGQVRVEVRDTGPGIPPQEQKRIFDAFYRFSQSGEATEGTGLGLAITQDLLMKPANGWEVLLQLKNDARTASVPIIVVTIVDQPGMGAALGADEYLVKPVERSALLAAVQRCLVRRGGAPPKRPILVIEDDTPTREVITELLTEQGYAVATASDGAEARAQVATSLPQLVILDLLLPRVSGSELLAEWRASPRTADLPVFILTSKDLTREEEIRLRAHAELLLRKEQPWQQTLLDQIRRVMVQNAPETV